MSYRDEDRYGSSRGRHGPSGDRDGPGGLLIILVLPSRLVQTTLSMLSVLTHFISLLSLILTHGCLYLRIARYH